MTREPSSTSEALSAWLDGEIDPAEAAELEAELARDPALKAELASLESVVRLLRDEGPAQAPLGFHHRVMARVEAEHPQRTPWWAWLRRPLGVPLEGWAIGLAAVIALVLVLPKASPPAGEPAPTGETSPAIVQTPPLPKEQPAPVAKDDAPAAAEPPPVRKGVEKVPRTEPGGTPQKPEILGKVTTGEEQSAVTPTVVLPPPTELAPVPKPGPPGTAEGNDPVQRFTVASDDPKVWQAVLRTCGRLGKTVGKLSGTMSSSVQKATCHLPQTALPDFEMELRKSGYDVTVAPSAGLVPGTDVAVEVTVVVAGAEPKQAAPPRAASPVAE